MTFIIRRALTYSPITVLFHWWFLSYMHLHLAQPAVKTCSSEETLTFPYFFSWKCNILSWSFVQFIGARPLHPVLQSVSRGWPGAASFCRSCFLCPLGWPWVPSCCGQRLWVWTERLCTLVSTEICAAQHCPIVASKNLIITVLRIQQLLKISPR